MKCPKCDQELESVSLAGTELQQCNKCYGIWCDIGELGQAIVGGRMSELSRDPFDRGHDQIQVPCPKCGTEGSMVRLITHNHGIHIDKCSCCSGMWIDGSEIDKIADAVW